MFFLSHVCGETDGQSKSCRTSAVVLTKKKSHVHLRPFLYSDVRAVVTHALTFSRFEKKSACSPSAVNDFNKTYSTSAAPLLARNV